MEVPSEERMVVRNFYYLRQVPLLNRHYYVMLYIFCFGITDPAEILARADLIRVDRSRFTNFENTTEQIACTLALIVMALVGSRNNHFGLRDSLGLVHFEVEGAGLSLPNLLRELRFPYPNIHNTARNRWRHFMPGNVWNREVFAMTPALREAFWDILINTPTHTSSYIHLFTFTDEVYRFYIETRDGIIERHVAVAQMVLEEPGGGRSLYQLAVFMYSI
jgi:hypothetical protein